MLDRVTEDYNKEEVLNMVNNDETFLTDYLKTILNNDNLSDNNIFHSKTLNLKNIIKLSKKEYLEKVLDDNSTFFKIIFDKLNELSSIPMFVGYETEINGDKIEIGDFKGIYYNKKIEDMLFEGNVLGILYNKGYIFNEEDIREYCDIDKDECIISLINKRYFLRKLIKSGFIRGEQYNKLFEIPINKIKEKLKNKDINLEELIKENILNNKENYLYESYWGN
jgi:hypothetical protein